MSHEHEANKQCGDDRVCAVHASLGGACEWSGGSKVGERMETGKDPCPTRAKTHAAAWWGSMHEWSRLRGAKSSAQVIPRASNWWSLGW
jgi:hypothetical protein